MIFIAVEIDRTTAVKPVINYVFAKRDGDLPGDLINREGERSVVSKIGYELSDIHLVIREVVKPY